MRTGHNLDRERGVVFLALLVLIVVGLVAASFFFVMRAQDKNSANTNPPQSAETSALERNARNDQRKKDASQLAEVTAEFYADNVGKFPAVYKDGKLAGADSATVASSITLEHYQTVLFDSGAQPALAIDSLQLTTGASCGDGGAVATGSGSEFAVQYALEDADGSFIPQCVAS